MRDYKHLAPRMTHFTACRSADLASIANQHSTILDEIETAHMIRKGQLTDENIPAYR